MDTSHRFNVAPLSGDAIAAQPNSDQRAPTRDHLLWGRLKTDKEKIDILFLHTASDVRSNSERGFPIFSNRFGFIDRTRRTGHENRGNYYICIIALSTERGEEIMTPNIDDCEDSSFTL